MTYRVFQHCCSKCCFQLTRSLIFHTYLVNYTKGSIRILLQPQMPQKSILSFFLGASKTGDASHPDPLSPIDKKLNRDKPKRRRVITDSDDSLEDKDSTKHSPKGTKLRTSLSEASKMDSSPNVLIEKENIDNSKLDSEADICASQSHMSENLHTDTNHIDVSSRNQCDIDYDPSKDNYNPLSDCNWKKRESVPYLSLARTFECIEAISGRIKITEILCNFFRSVGLLSPSDFTTCVYLCLNRLGPAFEGNELGIGETVLLKALGVTTGVSIDSLKTVMKKHGDLGEVAENVRSRQRIMFSPKPLTVSHVFAKFKEIAAMTGSSSQSKKIDLIRSLLVACRKCEAKYLIRSLSGKLRIGLAEQTVLTALAQAAVLTPFHSCSAIQTNLSNKLLNASVGLSAEQWKTRVDDAILNVKKAYCVCPDYDRLIQALLADGTDGLSIHCYITPGIPLKPMLAHPTHGVVDVLKRFDESDFTCEYKYDGERAQIHILTSNQSAEIYSRNLENNTKKYPEIVNSLMQRVISKCKLNKHVCELLSSCPSVGSANQYPEPDSALESCIIDSEIVAWDRQAGHILPFQVLSTRKRKDVDESTLKVHVCVYTFDLLYINGISLIEQPLRIRRDILRNVFPEISGEFMCATSMDSSNTDEIQTFLDEAIKGKCEGLMIKTLDHNSTYELAKRSHSWLKLKKDYLDGVGDTLDLVVIGAFHGTGKRAGRYGGYLLACYDPDAEEYQTICKIGTGINDEQLASFSSFFKDHIIDTPKPYYQYTSSLMPDQWFEPVQVWEIKAADLSISPAHKAAAGLADPEKGISLRFPRFIRIRDDKKAEDATSSEQVFEFYKSQEQIKNQTTMETNNSDIE